MAPPSQAARGAHGGPPGAPAPGRAAARAAGRTGRGRIMTDGSDLPVGLNRPGLSRAMPWMDSSTRARTRTRRQRLVGAGGVRVFEAVAGTGPGGSRAYTDGRNCTALVKSARAGSPGACRSALGGWHRTCDRLRAEGGGFAGCRHGWCTATRRRRLTQPHAITADSDQATRGARPPACHTGLPWLLWRPRRPSRCRAACRGPHGPRAIPGRPWRPWRAGRGPTLSSLCAAPARRLCAARMHVWTARAGRTAPERKHRTGMPDAPEKSVLAVTQGLLSPC